MINPQNANHGAHRDPFLTAGRPLIQWHLMYIFSPELCPAFSWCAQGGPPLEEVELDLGPMGQLRGVVTHSKPYPNQDAPYFARPIYMFRNIPFAEHSVANERRFTQSVVRTSPYSLPGTVYCEDQSLLPSRYSILWGPVPTLFQVQYIVRTSPYRQIG